MVRVDELTLKAILERLKNNDQKAFLEIYSLYHKPLLRFISRFIKISAHSDDILQDVFLKVWEIRSRINPDLSFQSYLYRISRNLIYKYLKKAANDEQLLLENKYHFQPAGNDAELKLYWKQYEEKLNEAIQQLPPKRQTVFRLCRQQHKTYEQVAAELSISRNTVKEHMVLAMRSITNYLATHSDISLSLIVLLALTIL